MNKKFKLIDKTLCNFLCHHIKAIEPLVGQTTSYDNGMILGSYEYLHDPLFESLLTLVQPIVEEQYGKPLLPTYLVGERMAKVKIYILTKTDLLVK